MGGGKKKNHDKVELYFIGNNSVGVTGSCIYGIYKDEKFLLELGGVQDGTVLENYRANKALLDRIDFENINYIFVNHFHQDHEMLVLSAVSRGFRGKIISNHSTARMSKILWEDTCHIMDNDIKYLRKSKGMKLEPLYKTDDVAWTLDYVHEYEENIVYNLSDNISLGYNIGMEWDGEEDGSPCYIYTLAPGFNLGEKWYAYVELFGFLNADNHPQHSADGGIAYNFSNNVKADISGGFGITKNTSLKNYIAAGFSFRLPVGKSEKQ
jgi:hypothetical protein